MPENVKHISATQHIVWTQAGFKKACSCLEEDGEREPIHGFPTKYPCVVTFVDAYRGYHSWKAVCVPLSLAISDARKYADMLVEADEKHREELGEITRVASKARREFLDLAMTCGAHVTGKPDGSEAISVVFTPQAWRAFDIANQDQKEEEKCASGWRRFVKIRKRGCTSLATITRLAASFVARKLLRR